MSDRVVMLDWDSGLVGFVVDELSVGGPRRGLNNTQADYADGHDIWFYAET